MDSHLIRNKIFKQNEHFLILESDLAQFLEIDINYLRQFIGKNRCLFSHEIVYDLTHSKQHNVCHSNKNTSSCYAFTHYGVIMLTSALNNNKAIEINLQVINEFMHLKYVSDKTTTVVNIHGAILAEYKMQQAIYQYLIKLNLYTNNENIKE